MFAYCKHLCLFGFFCLDAVCRLSFLIVPELLSLQGYYFKTAAYPPFLTILILILSPFLALNSFFL